MSFLFQFLLFFVFHSPLLISYLTCVLVTSRVASLHRSLLRMLQLDPFFARKSGFPSMMSTVLLYLLLQ